MTNITDILEMKARIVVAPENPFRMDSRALVSGTICPVRTQHADCSDGGRDVDPGSRARRPRRVRAHRHSASHQSQLARVRFEAQGSSLGTPQGWRAIDDAPGRDIGEAKTELVV